MLWQYEYEDPTAAVVAVAVAEPQPETEWELFISDVKTVLDTWWETSITAAMLQTLCDSE